MTAPPQTVLLSPLGRGKEEGDDEGKPDNPAAQKASREAAKWRNKFREAEARIAELEADDGDSDLADENRLLRIQLEFERQGSNINDPDAAWRLVQDDLAAVDVDDDGSPDADRVGEIVAHVVHRYPYAPADADGGTAPSHNPPPAGPSGAPVNGPKKPTDSANPSTLYLKFPALGRRR